MNLYIENNKKSISGFQIMLYSKSFLLNQNDWLLFYVKLFLNRIILKKFYLKNTINKKFNFQKLSILSTLWPIKFFITKEKHTFLLYNKNFNGFGFFNFFMFHTNKNKKICISNFLFFGNFISLKV